MTNPDSSIFDFDPDAQPTDQRTITVCHVNEDYDVYGGRTRGGKAMGDTEPPYRGWLGNPYRVADHGRQECIEKFEQSYLQHLTNDWAFCNAIVGLEGQRVACHCRHSDEENPSCHLDVIRRTLLDGTVHRIADAEHDIALTEAQYERMADQMEVA